MENQDFTITFLVDQTPKEVFDAVNNVRGWWSEAIAESTYKLNDEFTYRHPPVHYSKQKLIEVIPNKRVAWLITDSQLTFVEHKTEWTGTKVVFEITEQGKQTQLRFTHYGLVPRFECYGACSGGWSYYLEQSLLPLITTGKGQPDEEELKSVNNNA